MNTNSQSQADSVKEAAQGLLADLRNAEAQKNRERIQAIADHIHAQTFAVIQQDKDFRSDLIKKQLINRNLQTEAESVSPRKIADFLTFIRDNISGYKGQTQASILSILHSVSPSNNVHAQQQPTAPQGNAVVATPQSVANPVTPPVQSATPRAAAISAEVQSSSPSQSITPKKRTWWGYAQHLNENIHKANKYFGEDAWLGYINVFSPKFVLRKMFSNDEK